MAGEKQVEKVRYRVWIVRYKGQPPARLHVRPARSIALRPAEAGTMSRREAWSYVAAFNRAARSGPGRVWAVALPVTVRYAGDPQPDRPLAENA